jgi:hypothetical protein
MLLFSAVMRLMKPSAVLQGFAHFGCPESLIVGIGILEISCTIVYLIPRTSVLGAILVTAYLRGATATLGVAIQGASREEYEFDRGNVSVACRLAS